MTKIFRTVLCLCLLAYHTQAQEFNPKKYKVIEGYEDFVLDTDFSPNNNYLAVTVKNNTVELRDKNFDVIWRHQNNPKSFAGEVAFAPDEKHMVFTKYLSSRDAGVLNIATKEVVQKLKTGFTPTLEYSPDSKYLITAGRARERQTGIIKVWQWKKSKFELLQTFMYKNRWFQYFHAIRFSPNGKYFALHGITGNVIIYKKRKGQFEELQQIPGRGWMRSMAFHPNGKHLVFNTKSWYYSLDLLGNGRFRKFVYADSIRTFGGDTWDMEFVSKGKYLVAARSNGAIKVYEWDKGRFSREEEDIYTMHTNSALAMDVNKNLMVSGGGDKKVIIYALGKLPITQKPSIKKGGDQKQVDLVGDDLKIDVGAKGKNYLLVVGINKYKFWNPLGNATTDAQKVKQILQKRYGFEKSNIFEVYNEQATSKNILEKLAEIRKKITPNDNLLLYYSGHGYYNAAIEEGFWIPFNAKKGEETQYLANSTLLKYIKAVKARHIFLVADACFSGSLFTQGKRGYIENVEKFRSRWGFASGRLEFVSDGDIGKSSPFATYFLKFLTENQKKRFPISELIQYVKVAVSNNANQTPIGHPLKNVGDEGGEFVFYLKK